MFNNNLLNFRELRIPKKIGLFKCVKAFKPLVYVFEYTKNDLLSFLNSFSTNFSSFSSFIKDNTNTLCFFLSVSNSLPIHTPPA